MIPQNNRQVVTPGWRHEFGAGRSVNGEAAAIG
jgi:hypothetical protein